MSDDGQDFLSTITNGQASDTDLAPPKAASAQAPTSTSAPAAPKFASDLDAVVRTAYGEDVNHPDAIAAVINNRAKASGQSYSQVVTAPSQFEAWSNPDAAARMMRLDPKSAVYQQIASEVAPVLAGKVDPTGGADSYYNPTLQAADGRPKPAMDDGTGQKIGDQLYFKGAYSGGNAQGGTSAPADDFLGTITAGKASDADLNVKQPGADAPVVNQGEFVNNASATELAPSKASLAFNGNDDQQASARRMHLDPTTPVGSPTNPFYQKFSDQDVAGSLNPGAYYLDWNGKLQQTPGKALAPGEAPTHGFAQGLQDVGNTIANLDDVNPAFEAALAKTSPMAAQNLERQAQNHAQQYTEQQAYNARYGNNGWATLGRIGGNIVGTAPVMALAPEAGAIEDAGAAGNVVGQLGNFAFGGAGKGAGAVNLLTRAGSLAARGSVEGAAASGLTSPASDEPLGNQLLGGAIAGGLVHMASPAIGAAAKGGTDIANSLFEPLTDSGRTKIVNNFLTGVADGGPTDIDAQSPIPGVQRTLAQATGNPGIAAQERSMRSNPNFNNAFTGMAESNNQARQSFLTGIVGDENDLQALKDQRDAVATPLRQQAFASATQADPRPVINAIDQVLQSPSGQRDVVSSALDNIRSKLATTGPGGQVQLQTDPEQLYGIRQAIGDMLNPLSAGTQSDKRLASSELMGVKQSLDDAIEQAAPGYKDYLQQYSQLSRPVDEAQYLQSLKIDDGNLNGQITLGKVNSAITQIEKAQALPGVNPAKSVSNDTMNSLYALRDDLRAAGRSDLGRGTGSDTAQKLASDGLRKALTATKIGNVLLATAGAGAGAAAHGAEGATFGGGAGALLGAGANAVYAQKAGAIDNKLTNFLLDPNAAGLNLGSNGAQGGGVAGMPMYSPSMINNSLVPAGVSTAGAIRNRAQQQQTRNRLLGS